MMSNLLKPTWRLPQKVVFKIGLLLWSFSLYDSSKPSLVYSPASLRETDQSGPFSALPLSFPPREKKQISGSERVRHERKRRGGGAIGLVNIQHEGNKEFKVERWRFSGIAPTLTEHEKNALSEPCPTLFLHGCARSGVWGTEWGVNSSKAGIMNCRFFLLEVI